MKPVIGITPDFRPPAGAATGGEEPTFFLRARYARPIAALGGVPLILPITTDPALQRAVLERIDGLLITGSGPDLDPRLYGERQRLKFARMHPDRAAFELALVRRAVAADLPVLGICGGLQLLNVAFGGSLIQDIPRELEGALPHRPPAAHRPAHAVEIRAGSRLHRIVAARRIRVNSAHHQAPKAVGRGLIVNAVAADGVIEGLEHSVKRFVLGVQWHPEYLWERDARQRRLFTALLRAARPSR
jgi:putative glutamine amidotransferase